MLWGITCFGFIDRSVFGELPERALLCPDPVPQTQIEGSEHLPHAVAGGDLWMLEIWDLPSLRLAAFWRATPSRDRRRLT